MTKEMDDLDSYQDQTEWETVALDSELCIHDEDGGEETRTVREWINEQAQPNERGWFSRLLCSTEY